MKRPWQTPGRPLLPAAARPAAGMLLAACVLITAAIGAWVAHQTQAGTVDRAVDGWIIARTGGRDWIVAVTRSVGDPQWVTAVCAVLVLACVATRRYRSALLVAVAVPLAGAMTEYALKPLFGRTFSGFLSYPSGHVTGVSATALAAVVVLTSPARLPLPAALRWLLSAVALLAVPVVALAVIAGHYHYFTDTIGGAAVGTGTVLATALVLDWASQRLAGRQRAAPEPAARDGMTAAVRRLPRT